MFYAFGAQGLFQGKGRKDIGEGGKGVTLIVFRCGYFEKFLHSWTGMHCSKFNTKQVLIIVTNG